MATREPGFYWVRHNHPSKGGKWEVAEWSADIVANFPESPWWLMTDSEEGCHDEDLFEIGPRLTPPPFLSVVDVEKWITLPGWVLVNPKAP